MRLLRTPCIYLSRLPDRPLKTSHFLDGRGSGVAVAIHYGSSLVCPGVQHMASQTLMSSAQKLRIRRRNSVRCAGCFVGSNQRAWSGCPRGRRVGMKPHPASLSTWVKLVRRAKQGHGRHWGRSYEISWEISSKLLFQPQTGQNPRAMACGPELANLCSSPSCRRVN